MEVGSGIFKRSDIRLLQKRGLVNIKKKIPVGDSVCTNYTFESSNVKEVMKKACNIVVFKYNKELTNEDVDRLKCIIVEWFKKNLGIKFDNLEVKGDILIPYPKIYMKEDEVQGLELNVDDFVGYKLVSSDDLFEAVLDDDSIVKKQGLWVRKEEEDRELGDLFVKLNKMRKQGDELFDGKSSHKFLVLEMCDIFDVRYRKLKSGNYVLEKLYECEVDILREAKEILLDRITINMNGVMEEFRDSVEIVVDTTGAWMISDENSQQLVKVREVDPQGEKYEKLRQLVIKGWEKGIFTTKWGNYVAGAFGRISSFYAKNIYTYDTVDEAIKTLESMLI